MVQSQWKVRSSKEIIKFRKDNDITRCQCCGVYLKRTPHHFLCDNCWDIKKNKPLEWNAYFKRTFKKYGWKIKFYKALSSHSA